MPQKKKPTFSSFKIHTIASGDLLQEKPIFCDKGKGLVVSSKETCHLYNSSTGEHVKELFKCDSSIIRLQIDWSDSNTLYAVSQTGCIVSYAFDSENETAVKLKLDPTVLKECSIPMFNVNSETCSWEDHTPDINWEETLKQGVKFVDAAIAKHKYYASWRINNEFFTHLSVFTRQGELKRFTPIRPDVGLLNAPHNFIVGKSILLCMSVDFIYVQSLSNSNVARKHMIGVNAEVTCIALSQDESFFATGDSKGRILVWKNFFEKTPIKDIFHWHQLPVRALTFTDLGTNMFSGGDENVLVKWSLSSRQKTFLPRLSSALLHIAFAEGNDLLAVSTADSRILIINMSLACLTTIQHFSRWSAVGVPFEGKVLTHEPRTDALVLNGRTGHIQFLSAADRGRFLYTFDVTNRNFITRDQQGIVENVEVRFAKFSRCGKWLVTAESGADEANLKFWAYDETKQEFRLNTVVDSPHGLEGFRSLEVSFDEQAVTTGPDNKFRLWNLIETNHLQQMRMHWAEVFSAGYRNLPVTVADFARDGSIAGVGFGPALAIWDTDSWTLKCTLTPPLRRNHVKAVHFGNHEVSHLVVTGTDVEITCWNLVTLCMQWMVPLQLSTLVSDPNSLYMCAFSKKGGLFLFSPLSAFPELRLENVCESQVNAGVFVTHAESFCVYFLTANQELYCLGEDEKVVSVAQESPVFTPFRSQIAETTTKDVKKAIGLTHIFAPASTFPMSILDGPAHTLPPVSLLLHDVLKSLLLTVVIPEKSIASAADEVVAIAPHESKDAKNLILEEPQLRTVVERLFKQ